MKVFGLHIPFTAPARPPSQPPLRGSVIQSPVAAPQHAQVLRDFQEFNRKMFRSYDAALTNNFNTDFNSTFGSANAEVLTSLYLARGRARTLVKDSPHGKAIQRAFQNNVVGHDPFRLKMRVGKFVADGDAAPKFIPESEINRRIEEEWEVAGRPENFSVRRNLSRLEAWRIMEASVVRDGSILIRHWRGFPNNKYGYAVDLLEADRLQESYTGRAPNGNMIRFSVEFDSWNAPAAYWLLSRHPGDAFGASPLGGRPVGDNRIYRERVEARDIIHFNNLRDRAEQDIGFTELDCIVQQLHRDRQYDISLTYAAIASCCKPFWIKKEFPTGMQYTPETMELLLNGNGPNGPQVPATSAGLGANVNQRTSVTAPAATEVFDYGQSLQQIDPRFPVEAASEFKKDNMRAAAVGVGIAYQSISGDFQNLGFSASRQSELPQRDYFKVRQKHFIETVVRVHFREWLRAAIMSGALNLDLTRLDEFVNAARFQGRRWAYVNPLQDIQADVMSVEHGFKSPQQVQDELEDGISLEDLYSLFEEARLMQESHDLVFATEAVQQPTVDVPGDDGAPPEPGKPQPKPKEGGAQTITKAKRRSGARLSLGELLQLQGDGRNGYRD